MSHLQQLTRHERRTAHCTKLILLVAVLVCGKVTFGQQPAAKKPESSPEQDVQAAMDDAIARLKSGDVVGFIEFYFPVDELRAARKGRLGKSFQRIRNPTAAAKVAARLERAKRTAPKINLGGFLATFTIPEPDEDSTDIPAQVVPDISQKKLDRYPGTLAEALQLAITDLQAKRVEAFVDRLFPRGESGHPDAALRRKQLKLRLAQHPEMIEQMVADLQSILRTQQVRRIVGTVATISVKGKSRSGKRGDRIQLPDRTFRFEKTDGSWRFKDTTSELVKVQAQVAAKKPPSLGEFGTADAIIMERFGDRWRFVEF